MEGYQGAVYKSFKNKADAENFLNIGYCYKGTDIPLRYDKQGLVMPLSDEEKREHMLVEQNFLSTHDIDLNVFDYICYTDGACYGNPGPGGWGVILFNTTTGEMSEHSGYHPDTTNNRMEIQAMIEGLNIIKDNSRVLVVSDSKFVIDSLTKGWTTKHKQNGWIKADGNPVANVDLWEQILNLLDYHQVEFYWVKGHSSTIENNRCDELAVNEYKSRL